MSAHIIGGETPSPFFRVRTCGEVRKKLGLCILRHDAMQNRGSALAQGRFALFLQMSGMRADEPIVGRDREEAHSLAAAGAETVRLLVQRTGERTSNITHSVLSTALSNKRKFAMSTKFEHKRRTEAMDIPSLPPRTGHGSKISNSTPTRIPPYLRPECGHNLHNHAVAPDGRYNSSMAAASQLHTTTIRKGDAKRNASSQLRG